jgi:D-tyrosyl-tRNA(Tyr) deacylase
MIALLQRVSRAEVAVDGQRIAAIGRGLLVLVGVERNDDEKAAKRLAERLVQYRVFADSAGRMNLSVREAGGGVLLVPQFTLAADTRQGNRAGFSAAADPESGRRLFDLLVNEVAAMVNETRVGRFGASMQVSLTNEGPVTFWLQVSPPDVRARDRAAADGSGADSTGADSPGADSTGTE